MAFTNLRVVGLNDIGLVIKRRNSEKTIPFKYVQSVYLFEIRNAGGITVIYFDESSAEILKTPYQPEKQYLKPGKEDPLTVRLKEQAVYTTSDTSP